MENLDKEKLMRNTGNEGKSSIDAVSMKLLSKSTREHSPTTPQWFNSMVGQHNLPLLSNSVREWNDEEWRVKPICDGGGGFSGRDFCHSPGAAVRILDYCMIPSGSSTFVGFGEEDGSGEGVSFRTQFPQLVGPVHFTPSSESHKGLCHGGSFCALMDDAIGWTGFCVSGKVKPWSGYTVQVNTSLRRPVPVGSVLRLEAWVARKEGRRKYWVRARLIENVSSELSKSTESDATDTSSGMTPKIYCEADGLFLLNPEEVE